MSLSKRIRMAEDDEETPDIYSGEMWSQSQQSTDAKPLTDCHEDVIRRICSYLDVADLFNVSKLCVLLYKCAKRELENRRRVIAEGKHYLNAELLSPMGYSGRYGHAICYHAPEHRVYVCGGRSDQQGAILNDVSYYDLKTGCWEKGIYRDATRFIPSKCLYASMVSYKNLLILFGGYQYNTMPAQSLAQIFVLDLNNKCWTSVFCQRNVRNVHGHSALMMKDRWMVTFGGHTMNENGGGNEMYCVDCANITTMVPVNQINDPPSPRVFPALAFVDNRLLVVGGRTQIEGNYTILKDAHMFTFTDDDQYSSGFWATIEIEGVDLWPKCTPTFAQAGNNTLYMVSQATEKTHVLLDNDLLSKLYNTKQADIHFELLYDQERRPRCSDRLKDERRRDSQAFSLNSGRYPHDRLSLDSMDFTINSSQDVSLITDDLDNTDLSESQKGLARDCERIIREYHEKRNVKLFDDDLQCILLWLNSGNHSNVCGAYKSGSYKGCSGTCFKVGGCMYDVLRHFYAPASTQFLQQLCATLYHITAFTCKDSFCFGPDYDRLKECQFWMGEKRNNAVPLTRLLAMQSLIPVHRAIFDVPLSVAVYKFDLRHLVTTLKITLKQDPVRFMAPLYNRDSAMVFAEHGLFLCGGLEGEWAHLIPNFPTTNQRRPSTATILIS